MRTFVKADQCAGKTIEACELDFFRSKYFVVTFTDGTYTRIESGGELSSWQPGPNAVVDRESLYVRLGIATKAEIEDIRKREDAEWQEQVRNRARKELRRLMEKYGATP